MIIFLLECLMVKLEIIDLISSVQSISSPTLKTPLYLMFTTKSGSVEFPAMISIPILMHNVPNYCT